MGTRADVLHAVDSLAFGYAFLDPEDRRGNAFANALRTLKKFPDLEGAWRDGTLAETRGIGKGVLGVVERVFTDQPLPDLEELRAQIPEGLFEARKLPGIGPARLRTLHSALGVTTVGEIAYACNENRLLALPGFGVKTQAKVLAAIEAMREVAGQLRLDQALAAAQAGATALTEAGARRVAIVGDARRGTETTTEATLLARVDRDDWAAAAAALGAEITEGRPEDAGLAWLRWRADGAAIAAALCPWDDQWGALMVLTTGGEAHVEALKDRANRVGMLLGPLGLWRGADAVPTASEDDVYEALGLVPTPPERREADVPLVGRGQAWTRLVTRADLLGALHNHTTASDGVSSLEAMRDAATDAGLAYLGVSDHSETAAYAGGLEASRLLAQVEEIRALNASGSGAFVLSGVESDILREGALDYAPEVLAQLDVVIASVHTRHKLDHAGATERMVRAARDPYTDIIGHPTGRLILGRAPTDYDVAAMLDACAESGCAVELNANPQRLDLNERWLAEAKARGVKVSIAADAHSAQALAHLDYGVIIARRAGLTPDDVLNCLPLADLRAWLSARRQRAMGRQSA